MMKHADKIVITLVLFRACFKGLSTLEKKFRHTDVARRRSAAQTQMQKMFPCVLSFNFVLRSFSAQAACLHDNRSTLCVAYGMGIEPFSEVILWARSADDSLRPDEMMAQGELKLVLEAQLQRFEFVSIYSSHSSRCAFIFGHNSRFLEPLRAEDRYVT